MTRTLLRIAWMTLRRDRVALLLTFVVPIVFFTIFTAIFGGLAGGDGLPEIELVLADEDGSPASRRLVEALVAEEGLKGPGKGDPRPVVVADREAARERVLAGDCDLALVIPPGFGDTFAAFGGDRVPVRLYADAVANPVAHQVVQGLLQKTAMTAAPDLLVRQGMAMFEQHAGGLTDQQQAALDQFLPYLEPGGAAAGAGNGPQLAGLVQVEVEDVRRRDESDREKRRYVAFQAAGTGVLFLLFSMAGAASSLLREEQTGTLGRLLDSGVGMGRLLAGYWSFAALLGFVQVSLMFVWGWGVFGLELWTPGHLGGFLVMTTVTAAAAAAFGLALGTASRSLAQLNGLSTVVILVMSAIGGSMVPRFLLRRNPVMDKLGLVTFNAWAIDGYQKVFWYETGLLSLWPQVLVLMALTGVFLAVARRFARRWETV